MTIIEVDRATGAINGAPFKERALIGGLRASARLFMNVRGYCRVCQTVANAFAPSAEACVDLNADSRFCFSVAHPYWVRLITRSWEYEPEIRLFLERLPPFAFLDGGANLGYWSVLASSKAFGSAPTVAIEPGSASFAALEKNAALNGYRFACVKAALWDRSGEAMELRGRDGPSASIAGDASVPVMNRVETVSIDSVVATHARLTSRPLVLKLDVEGAEIMALRGADATLRQAPLLLYEDHARDREHRPSRFVMNELGWQLYMLADDGPRLVHALDDIARYKVLRIKGYNLAAVARRSYWSDVMQEVTRRR